MREKVRFLGLDVHAETIAVAIAEPAGKVRSLGTIANREESIPKLVRKLGPVEQLRACYEAGPTGYVLYWQLTRLGVDCAVIAPTLVPVKAGDRVKTDRRDALKLARCHRAGDLTPVWVPDEGSEALRDLVRAREAAKADQLRARHRLSKFLLRTGRRPESKMKAWTGAHMTWVRQLRFQQPAQESTRLDYLHEVEHMAERVLRLEQAIRDAIKLASPEMQEVIKDLQALRGIAEISAVTIVSELGEISRFESARQLMGYSRGPRGQVFVRGVGAARCPVRIPAASAHNAAALPRRATRTSDASPSKRPGVIGSGQASAQGCASGRGACRKRSRRLPGRRKSGSRDGMPGWRRPARTRARSSPPWRANCRASSGPSASRLKRPANKRWRHDKRRTKTTAKAKTFQRMKKQKQNVR